MTSLDDLPPKILRRICEYALPQEMTFSFENRTGNWNSGCRLVWVVWAAVPPHHRVVVRRRIWVPYNCRGNERCTACTPTPESFANHNLAHDMHFGLLRVSKSIANEARATFFSNNIIALKTSEEPREFEPVELKLSAIFGPFGLFSNPNLIRDLRRVDLNISVDRRESEGVATHLVRINHFIKMIKQHAVDKDKKPLLRRLHVRLISKYGFKEHLYPDMAPG